MFNFGITKTIFMILFCFIIIFFITNIIRQYRSGKAFKFSHLFSFKHKTAIIFIFIIILLLLIGSVSYFFKDKNNPRYNEQLFHEVDNSIKKLEGYETEAKGLLKKHESLLSQQQKKLETLLNNQNLNSQEKQRIENKINEIKEALTTYRLNKATAISEQRKKEIELAILNSDKEAITNRLNVLNQRYSAATSETLQQQIFEEIQKEQNNLTPIQTKINTLKREIDELQIKIDAINDQIDTKEKELKNMKKELQIIQAKIKINDRQIKTVENIIKEIETEKEALLFLIERIRNQKEHLGEIKRIMGDSLASYDEYRVKNEFNSSFVLKCITQLGIIATDLTPLIGQAKASVTLVEATLKHGIELSDKVKNTKQIHKTIAKQLNKVQNQEFLGRAVNRGVKMYQNHRLLFDQNGCIKMLSKDSYNIIMNNIKEDEAEFEKDIKAAQARYDALCQKINNNEDINKANTELLSKGFPKPQLVNDIATTKAEYTKLEIIANDLEAAKRLKQLELLNEEFCQKHYTKRLEKLKDLYNRLDNPNENHEQLKIEIINTEQNLNTDIKEYLLKNKQKIDNN